MDKTNPNYFLTYMTIPTHAIRLKQWFLTLESSESPVKNAPPNPKIQQMWKSFENSEAK